MAVTCVAKLTPTEECGIDAQGRCSRCGRPYCATHLGAAGLGSNHYVCGQCVLDEQLARKEAETQRQAARLDSTRKVAELVARLNSHAGTRGLTSRRIQIGERKRAFRGYEPTFRLLESAWPVGRVSWIVVHGSKDGEGQYHEDLETGVTPSGDIVVMQPYSSYGMMGGYRKDISANIDTVLLGLVGIARRFNIDIIDLGY